MDKEQRREYEKSDKRKAYKAEWDKSEKRKQSREKWYGTRSRITLSFYSTDNESQAMYDYIIANGGTSYIKQLIKQDMDRSNND